MGYIERREQQRISHKEEIVAAAEKEFLKAGFEKTSMDAIAKEAQFTKRTIYQYFSSKEELFFAVAAKLQRHLLQYYQESLEKEQTFFSKLRALGDKYYEVALNNPDLFHLLNQSHFISVDYEKSENLKELENVRLQGLIQIIDLIKGGQSEGDIRKDLDPQKAASALILFLIGYFFIISEGNKKNYDSVLFGKADFVKYSLDLLYSAIKN